MTAPTAPTGTTTDDAGFTLVELLMVTFLMGVIGVLLYSALSSFLLQTEVTTQQSRALVEARSAVETISKDLRAANPVDELPTGRPLTDYDMKVSFDVFCTPATIGCPVSNLRKVTYEVVNQRLERTLGTGPAVVVVGPTGARGRNAVVNDPATQPVFRYYDKLGRMLRTSTSRPCPSDETCAPDPVSARQFRDCARSVGIYFVIRAADTGDRSVNMKTRIDLRNANEVTGCV